MLELKNVGVAFGRQTVLKGANLRIDPGEFVCLVGPSGSGKTTVLNLLIGAQEPTIGQVLVDSIDLAAVPPVALQILRQRVGIIFQDRKLIPHRSVTENIGFPLEICGADDSVIEKRVKELLKRMDLSDHADSLPNELSGGEQARTAIARAVAHKPLIVIADEPTGNLDEKQREDVLQLLLEIHKDGATVILATHDKELISGLKKRVVEIRGGAIAEAKSSVAVERDTKTERKTPMQMIFTEKHAEQFGPEVEMMEEVEKDRQKSGKKIRITSIHSGE